MSSELNDMEAPKKTFLRRFLWLWIVVAIGLIIFGFAAYRGTKNDNNSGTSKDGETEKLAGGMAGQALFDSSLPTCPADTSGLFTKAFMDGDKPDFIVPLGNSNQSGHVVPVDHVYPNDFGKETDVPVYAPSDMTLIWIENKQMHNSTTDAITRADYQLNFAPCRGLNLAFIHLKKLSIKLDAAIEDENSNCDNSQRIDYGTQEGIPTYYTTCHPVFQKVRVSAGEVIGYFSGSTDKPFSGFDIGLYDFNKPDLAFANPDRYYEETNHTVCFADYYTSELREKYRAKFGTSNSDKSGETSTLVKRVGEPLCGQVMWDLPGTAQGDWFKGAVQRQNTTDNNALVLIHDNIYPEKAKMSWAEITSYLFTPRHTGTVNREFSEVTADGKTYCYQSDDSLNARTNYVDKDGKTVTQDIKKYLIQLVDDTHLKAEQQSGTCGTSEAFNSPTNLER